MEFTKEELMFMSECLISYQAALLNVRKLTFGSLNDATSEQVSIISKLNTKIMDIVDNSENIRKD